MSARLTLPPSAAAEVDATPTSPFYLVWAERGRCPQTKHATFARARAEAERLASENPGAFHVLAAVATAQLTNLAFDQYGFDPSRDFEPRCDECGLSPCECIPF